MLEPHLFYKQYWLHLQDTLICYQDNKHLQKGKTTNFFANFLFRLIHTLLNAISTNLCPCYVLACRFANDAEPIRDEHIRKTYSVSISEHSPFFSKSNHARWILFGAYLRRLLFRRKIQLLVAIQSMLPTSDMSSAQFFFDFEYQRFSTFHQSNTIE